MKTKNNLLKWLLSAMCLVLLSVFTVSAQTSEPQLKVKQKNGKFGLTVKDGFLTKKILPYEYDSIVSVFSDRIYNFFSVYKDNKEGLFNCSVDTYYNGKYNEVKTDTAWILPCAYDSLWAADGLKRLYPFQNGKIGAISLSFRPIVKKVIMPCEYDDCKIAGDIYLLRKGDKWGVSSYGEYSNKLVENIPFEYDEITLDVQRGFSDIYAYLKKDGKWGYTIVTPIYSYKDYTFPLIPCEYDRITTCYIGDNGSLTSKETGEAKGMLLQKGNKYGWASAKASPKTNNFEILLPCEYDNISSMNLNYAYYLEIQKDSKVGLFSLSENKIIIPLGDYVAGSETPVGDRITMSRVDGKSESYDRKGNKSQVVWAQRVDAQKFLNMGSGDFFYVSKTADGPYTAIVNKNDKVIVNLANTKVKGYVTNSNTFYCLRNGKIGVISGATGAIIAPFSFDGFLDPKIGRSDRVLVYKNTNTGQTLSVYTTAGKLLAQRAFRNSQPYAMERFLKDYLY